MTGSLLYGASALNSESRICQALVAGFFAWCRRLIPQFEDVDELKKTEFGRRLIEESLVGLGSSLISAKIQHFDNETAPEGTQYGNCTFDVSELRVIRYPSTSSLPNLDEKLRRRGRTKAHAAFIAAHLSAAGPLRSFCWFGVAFAQTRDAYPLCSLQDEEAAEASAAGVIRNVHPPAKVVLPQNSFAKALGELKARLDVGPSSRIGEAAAVSPFPTVMRAVGCQRAHCESENESESREKLTSMLPPLT